MKIKDGVLLARRVSPNSGGLALDLNEILAVEARIGEIAHVNPHKAPELLAAFNKAWLDAGDHLNKLEEEINNGEQYIGQVRGEILLDRADGILRERGLKGSADLRQAIVDTDPEYIEASSRLRALQAARASLKNKQKAFEMAYHSVRRIVGENAYNRRNKPGTDIGQDTPVGGTDHRSGFGKPVY